jgi:hypothetical protein
MARVADVDPLRDLADRVIRESLLDADNLRAFLEVAVPDLAAGFDCSRRRLLERGFPLEDWRRREADLPFEIPYRVGDTEVWALVCVLLEHQSDTDPLIPLRLLLFAVMYWDRQWHQWEQLAPPRPAFRLNPVLPIVLYTGPRPWGSNRTLRDLLGEPAVFHAFAPDWQPLFWNLSEQTPQQLLQTGREWLQALAVVRAQDEAGDVFATVFTEAVQRLSVVYGRNHVRWYDLMRLVFTYAAWKRPAEERQRLFAAVADTQEDLTRREEVEQMEKKIGATLADLVRLRTRRDVLRELLEERFGTLPEGILQRIESCEEVSRLQAAARQVLRLEKLDDFQL